MHVLAVVLGFLAAGSPALAAGAGAPPASASASNAAASEAGLLSGAGCSTDAQSVKRSYEFFAKAGEAYEAHDVSAAIAAMKQAHAISSCHEFLFMVAELYAEQQETCVALEWYRRYIRELPNGASAQQAQDRVTALTSTCPPRNVTTPLGDQTAELPPAPVPAPMAGPTHGPRDLRRTAATAEPSHASAYWSPARVAGWSSVGLGAAAGLSAVYFAVQAANREAEYESAWRERTFANADELWDDGEAAERAGQISGVAAGAFATAGVVLLFVASDSDASPDANRVSLYLDRNAFSAAYVRPF